MESPVLLIDLVNETSMSSNSNSSNCTVGTEEFAKKMFYAVVVPSSISIVGAILVIVYSLGRMWNVPRIVPSIVHYVTQVFQKRPEVRHLLGEEHSHNQPTPAAGAEAQARPQTPNYGIISDSSEFGHHELSTSEPDGSTGACTAAINHPSAHLLLYISLADVVVALSHIWGVSMTREDLAQENITHTSGWLTECGAQAVLAVFGTIASFLWTLVLAFMAVVMASNKVNFRSLTKSTFCFSMYHILLWGIPLFVVVGFGVQGKLGFDQQLDVGWCYVRGGVLALLFGYDLWAILYIFLLSVFISLFAILYYQNRKSRKHPLKVIKLLIAAFLLIGVRLPIAVHDFMMYHSRECPSEHFLLASGALTSTQGIINAMVFVLPQVFETVWKYLCRKSNTN